MCKAILRKYARFVEAVDDPVIRQELEQLLGIMEMEISTLRIENKGLKHLFATVMKSIERKYRKVLKTR